MSEAAWTIARLQRIKDARSREDLTNDIKNRAAATLSPEEILEELKRHHGVKVDAQAGQVEKVVAEPEAVVEDNA